jgi:hypothetical protein
MSAPRVAKPKAADYPYLPVLNFISGRTHNGDLLGWQRVYGVSSFVFACGLVMLGSGLWSFRRITLAARAGHLLQHESMGLSILSATAGLAAIQAGLTVQSHIAPE